MHCFQADWHYCLLFVQHHICYNFHSSVIFKGLQIIVSFPPFGFDWSSLHIKLSFTSYIRLTWQLEVCFGCHSVTAEKTAQIFLLMRSPFPPPQPWSQQHQELNEALGFIYTAVTGGPTNACQHCLRRQVVTVEQHVGTCQFPFW